MIAVSVVVQDDQDDDDDVIVVVHNNNTTNEQSLFLYAKALNKDHRSSKIRTFAARSRQDLPNQRN